MGERIILPPSASDEEARRHLQAIRDGRAKVDQGGPPQQQMRQSVSIKKSPPDGGPPLVYTHGVVVDPHDGPGQSGNDHVLRVSPGGGVLIAEHQFRALLDRLDELSTRLAALEAAAT